MRRVLIIILALALGSCARMPNYDTSLFESNANYVWYDGEIIAKVTNTEMAIDNGKFVREVTLDLVNPNLSSKVKPMLYYLWSKNKYWEYEVNVPIRQFNPLGQ